MRSLPRCRRYRFWLHDRCRVARRFTAEHIAGIEAGSAQVIERAVGLLSPQRREALAGGGDHGYGLHRCRSVRLR